MSQAGNPVMTMRRYWKDAAAEGGDGAQAVADVPLGFFAVQGRGDVSSEEFSLAVGMVCALGQAMRGQAPRRRRRRCPGVGHWVGVGADLQVKPDEDQAERVDGEVGVPTDDGMVPLPLVHTIGSESNSSPVESTTWPSTADIACVLRWIRPPRRPASAPPSVPAGR